MISSYEQALKYVFDFENTKDHSLEKVRRCAQKLWNLQDRYKVIHITWTNGKWSTCNMCFAVLKKAGKKVGIFTSPHLLDIRERFVTSEWMISKEDFVIVTNKIAKLDEDLSYFEKCTLIAFEYFYMKNCEYAIIEVWVGGLLDSTNIVNPLVTSITSIGFDHIDILWSTLEEIAFQKAWIIKPWIPVVINNHNEVIENNAKQKWSPIIFTDKLIPTNMIGEYQLRNASLAFEICKYIGISESIILEWLQKVRHRGRLEYITENILIDWAHNEQGLDALKNYIESTKHQRKKIIYCFSLKRWKAVKAENLILERFGYASDYVLVNYEHPMLCKTSDLEKALHWSSYEALPVSEIKFQAQKNPNTLFVVFGSLYMIGGFY